MPQPAGSAGRVDGLFSEVAVLLADKGAANWTAWLNNARTLLDGAITVAHESAAELKADAPNPLHNQGRDGKPPRPANPPVRNRAKLGPPDRRRVQSEPVPLVRRLRGGPRRPLALRRPRLFELLQQLIMPASPGFAEGACGQDDHTEEADRSAAECCRKLLRKRPGTGLAIAPLRRQQRTAPNHTPWPARRPGVKSHMRTRPRER